MVPNELVKPEKGINKNDQLYRIDDYVQTQLGYFESYIKRGLLTIRFNPINGDWK